MRLNASPTVNLTVTTLYRLKLKRTIFNDSVRTAQQTQAAWVITTNQLMLCSVIIALNTMKNSQILWEELTHTCFNVKPDGT